MTYLLLFPGLFLRALTVLTRREEGGCVAREEEESKRVLLWSVGVWPLRRDL